MSSPEPDHSRVPLWRPLVFASVALLAGCSHGGVGPAPATVTVVVPATPTVAVATSAVAPAHARSCRSNDDCSADHTGGLCMPKAETRELSDAEDFLGRAMSLRDLVTRLGDSSSSSRLGTIQRRVRDDMSMYGRIASGRGADGKGGVGQEAPLTNEQMQDAAWMQSGATQADALVRQFSVALSRAPITTDAEKVHTDITGDGIALHLDRVISDLQTFLQDIEVAVAPVNKLITLRESDGGPLTPKSGAGALLLYLGPVMKEIDDARSGVTPLLDPSVVPRLETDLTRLSEGLELVGKDGNSGTCLSPRDTASGAGTGSSPAPGRP
jgi:hypothetical protein